MSPVPSSFESNGNVSRFEELSTLCRTEQHMVTSEKEMVRPLIEGTKAPERDTVLQPTYEDSVPPDPEEYWDDQD
ncbi:hypothetical protein SAMN05421771_1216 [Granulicella pectinivorans]|uniref:Uncharacterized protein n=1 Tax=Granulicella pectinivorans TaxID=474950 RepID=A0A1I6LSQ1_9BACT|nr:hypothetical protein [Granulicella pectinivorans]SFS06493.1 hypothetical protein SAMN05421771_1216 [Granulicella pectinivorans]